MSIIACVVVIFIYIITNFAWIGILSDDYTSLTRWDVLLCVILLPATVFCCTIWVVIWLLDKINTFMSKNAW